MSGQIPFQSSTGQPHMGWPPSDTINHRPTPTLSSTPTAASDLRPSVCGTETLAGSPLIVGQDALQEYHAVCEVVHRRKKLRQSIVERLEAGALVESGRFTAYLRQCEQHRFSADRLVRLLGRAEVERLRRQLRPTVIVHLIVERGS